MVRLLSLSIGAGSIMIVLLPLMVFLRLLPPLKQYSRKRYALILLFAFYLAGVLTAVGIPAVGSLMIYPEFELIPLADLIRDPLGYAKTSILNILLFVPLGFLLPVIWARYRTARRTLLAGFGLSLAVEFLQIFTFRLTDVNDLIMNTLGTGLGYLLFQNLTEKLHLKSEKKPISPQVLAAPSPEIPPQILAAPLPEMPPQAPGPLPLCLLVFLIMFTVQPLLSGLMWRLILEIPLWELIR